MPERDEDEHRSEPDQRQPRHAMAVGSVGAGERAFDVDQASALDRADPSRERRFVVKFVQEAHDADAFTERNSERANERFERRGLQLGERDRFRRGFGQRISEGEESVRDKAFSDERVLQVRPEVRVAAHARVDGALLLRAR